MGHSVYNHNREKHVVRLLYRLVGKLMRLYAVLELGTAILRMSIYIAGVESRTTASINMFMMSEHFAVTVEVNGLQVALLMIQRTWPLYYHLIAGGCCGHL